jgi:hypothetical protein
MPLSLLAHPKCRGLVRVRTKIHSRHDFPALVGSYCECLSLAVRRWEWMVQCSRLVQTVSRPLRGFPSAAVASHGALLMRRPRTEFWPVPRDIGCSADLHHKLSGRLRRRFRNFGAPPDLCPACTPIDPSRHFAGIARNTNKSTKPAVMNDFAMHPVRKLPSCSTSSLSASLAVKMQRRMPCETARLRLRAIHQASRAKVLP